MTRLCQLLRRVRSPAAIAGLAVVLGGSSSPAHAQAPVPVGVDTVRLAPVREEVSLNGSLIARRTSRLSTETDGLVAAILVEDGDRVARGATVLELDRRLARLMREAGAARLAEAEARHAEAQRRYRELEQLRGSRHVAETTVASARSEIDIQAAAVRAARAELERLDEILAQHVVAAPFDAIVRRKLVEAGEWVETNTPIAELVEVSVLRVEVPVPQFYYVQVNAGTEVRIHLDAMPERSFEARVTRKIPVGDPASRTFRVWIDLPNEAGLLAPGMSARVTLNLAGSATAPALVLPRDAVVRKPDGSTNVWVVVVEDGVTRAVPRAIETGRAWQELVEVVAGELSAGEQVVVRGNEILRPGQSVRVASESERDI